MNGPITDLSQSVGAATSLEELARPLLEMLRLATGLESTYLTSVDQNAGEQQVKFALNASDLQIPEGLTVPWDDTLCKRSLEERTPVCSDVPGRWGDSAAATVLGIRTYASAPVRTSDGVLVGTLCAAGRHPVELGDWAQSTLNMFSKMVAQQIEREALLQKLQAANSDLAVSALTDPLTGLPNRRALIEELNRMLARSVRDDVPVLVGIIDLDDFKVINDKYGHQVGDRLLREVSHRMGAAVRATDMVARFGGDEFAIVGPGCHTDVDPSDCAKELQRRLSDAIAGRYVLGDLVLEYSGASVGVIHSPGGGNSDAVLQLADAAMYADKRRRKSRRTVCG